MRYDGTVPFNGAIDDVQIYDKALTAAEVIDLIAFQSRRVPDSANSMLLMVVGFCALIAFQKGTGDRQAGASRALASIFSEFEAWGLEDARLYTAL